MDTPKYHSIPTYMNSLDYSDTGAYPHIYFLYDFMELSGSIFAL